MSQGRPLDSDDWTRFLRELAKCGCLDEACDLSGLGRTAMFARRKTDEAFEDEVQAAWERGRAAKIRKAKLKRERRQREREAARKRLAKLAEAESTDPKDAILASRFELEDLSREDERELRRELAELPQRLEHAGVGGGPLEFVVVVPGLTDAPEQEDARGGDA